MAANEILQGFKKETILFVSGPSVSTPLQSKSRAPCHSAMAYSQLCSCHRMFYFIFSFCLFLLSLSVPHLLVLPILQPSSTSHLILTSQTLHFLGTAAIKIFHSQIGCCNGEIVSFSVGSNLCTFIILVLWHPEFRTVMILRVERNRNNSNIFACKCNRELRSVGVCIVPSHFGRAAGSKFRIQNFVWLCSYFFTVCATMCKHCCYLGIVYSVVLKLDVDSHESCPAVPTPAYFCVMLQYMWLRLCIHVSGTGLSCKVFCFTKIKPT